jgi:glutamine amidotransferase
MFHLALTLGLEENVPKAIAEMVKVVEQTARDKNVEPGIWMTLGISDGKSLWGFRYGTDGRCPTLYCSPSLDELLLLNPDIDGRFGDFAVCLVSEPIGNYEDAWHLLPENSMIEITNQTISRSAFDVEKQ